VTSGRVGIVSHVGVAMSNITGVTEARRVMRFERRPWPTNRLEAATSFSVAHPKIPSVANNRSEPRGEDADQSTRSETSKRSK
jgi:hypothetical protein